MFNAEEASRLRKAIDGLTNTVDLTFHQTEESEFGQKLASFVEEICQLSQGKIRSAAGSHDRVIPAYPCFEIGSHGQANIAYAALPLGHQFAPFLRALELVGGDRPPVSDAEMVSGGSDAEIQVFISEDCPRCPIMVDTVTLLTSVNSSISSFIVDAERFSYLVQNYGIKSVPATVLDRRLVLIGNVPADRLKALIEKRGSLKFEMEVVLSLIERGRIEEAADCLNHEAGREVILTLMGEPDFSKRLSALVVLERALDNNSDAVREMVPSIAALLDHTDARIRGDVADLLGKIGNAQTIAQLELLTADPDPDVAEAATEAISELRKKFL